MPIRNILRCLLLLCFLHLSYQGPIEVEIKNTIDEVYVNCRSNKNPGLVVAVVKDGQEVMTESFGVKDKISLEPVTKDTLFGLGGLSALFANVLFAKKSAAFDAINEDTTLRNLFGNNKIFKKSKLRSRYATTLDIMAHRLGIRNTPYLFLDETVTRGGPVIDRIANMRARGRFRDSMFYNEVLYSILTTIGERLGSDAWERLVDVEIYQPLGMNTANFTTIVSPSTTDIAQAYKDDEGTLYPVPHEFLKKWSRLCATTCVMSSVKDMAKFMKFLLGNGTIPGTSEILLSKKSHEDLFDAYNRLQNPSIEDYFLTIRGLPVSRTHFAYAQGIKKGIYNNERILESADDMFGYNTLLTLFPDHNLGIFIAMTGEDKDDLFRTALSSYISDLYLGKQAWLNATLLCSFPEPFMPAPPESTPKTHPEVPIGRNLEDFVGNYTSDIYGTASVVDENGNLKFIYGMGEFNLKREETESLKFNMFPTGLIEHLIPVDDLRFKEDPNTLQIESLRVDRFDGGVFTKESPPTTTTTTTTQAPVSAGGVAIPL
ncbi:gigasin-6-like [Saccostrea echinata]|uniref:gigasin-6-like n=1 Tax=Saccostrea echinata TaxID=191078 RepID=UPI002A82EF28|nr:gigasin-6-like [Saccostrea echinata]